MIYRFGPFSLDAERYELCRDGVPVAVEPRPLEVLAYLVAHRDRVVRKEELIDRLWDGRFVSESALTRAVREARRAVDGDGGSSWIEAVYGRGYRFTGEVEELPGVPSEEASAAAGEDTSGSVSPETSGSPPIAVARAPLPLTPLIGRAREVEEIRRLLATARVLTVTGASGTGKTRVALEVARAAGAGFPDGVAWVPLAEVTDPAEVLPTVARALRIADRPGREPLDVLAARLADRRLLLVLDNFEQVVAGAPALAELARRAPRLTLLVTSRFVLGVEGEQEYPLTALPVPAEGETDPGAIASSPAVTLFLDRARAVQPGLAVDGATLTAVGRLVRRLDGLPLALELAAARVKLLAPAEILERLGNRLDLLASRSAGRPARHQTLRQALDWSLELLADEERDCLFRLSVFAGGFTLDAAAEVACGAPESAVALLEALVDKSLVERRGRAAGGSRFALLETTRQIAAERLTENPVAEAAVRRAHAAWCRSLAGCAERSLAGGEGQLEWLERLDLEHANVLAALDHAVLSGEVETGLATAAAMWRWWSARGAYREGFERLEALVDHPAAVGATEDGGTVTRARARALGALGALAFLLWDLPTARRRLDEGLELARSLGDREAEAGLLTHLGWAHGEGGDLDRGEELSRCALALHRESGDLRGEAAAINNLAWLAIYRDDPVEAERLLRDNLALRRRGGDLRGAVMALVTLSWIDRSPGRLAERRELLGEARSLVERLDDRPLASYTRSNEGVLALDEGDPVAARRALDEGVAFFREVGHDFGIAWFLIRCAEVDLAEGRHAAARARLAESDPFWERIGNPWGVRMAVDLRRKLAEGESAMKGRSARSRG